VWRRPLLFFMVSSNIENSSQVYGWIDERGRMITVIMSGRALL
jgi:hypothetical protein